MGCLTFEWSSMKKNSLNQIFVTDLAADSWQFHYLRAAWYNRCWRKFSLYIFLTLGSKNEVRANYSWFGLCILIIQMIHGYIGMQEIQAHRGICTKREYPVLPFLAKLPTQRLTNVNSLGLPPVSFYNWCVVKYIYIYIYINFHIYFYICIFICIHMCFYTYIFEYIIKIFHMSGIILYVLFGDLIFFIEGHWYQYI